MVGLKLMPGHVGADLRGILPAAGSQRTVVVADLAVRGDRLGVTQQHESAHGSPLTMLIDCVCLAPECNGISSVSGTPYRRRFSGPSGLNSACPAGRIGGQRELGCVRNTEGS